MTRTEQVRIVQIVPFIGPGTGVAGVAFNLERELLALGARVERFTFNDALRGRSRPWPKTRLLARLRGGWRMVWFSTVGTRRMTPSESGGPLARPWPSALPSKISRLVTAEL